MSNLWEAGILPRLLFLIMCHTEALAEESHNFFYFMRFFAFAQNDEIVICHAELVSGSQS